MRETKNKEKKLLTKRNSGNKKPAVLLFAGLLLLLLLTLGGVLLMLLPKETYSEAERRPLKELPEPDRKTLLNGSFFSSLDDWAADHFPAREGFRKVKAFWQHNVLLNQENNGYVIYENAIIRLEKKINESSLAYAGERFASLYDRYLKDTGCRVYTSVIPDKSTWLEAAGFPVMDVSEMEKALSVCLPSSISISLRDTLSLSDYYLTDSHWRQEKLIPAAKRLLREMGAADDIAVEHFEIAEAGPFTGVYAEQSGYPYLPESICYLTGSYLDHVRVTDLEKRMPLPIYDPDNCDKRNLYTMFLGGSKAALRLENPDAGTDKELVIFRDSFAASLAPLLLNGYRAVTLIDPRYLSQEAISRFVRFEDQDVLFLFSAVLLNNSQGIR